MVIKFFQSDEAQNRNNPVEQTKSNIGKSKNIKRTIWKAFWKKEMNSDEGTWGKTVN